MGWVFSVGGGPRAYYDRFRRTEIAMVMVLVLLVVVRCPMVGEDDERQYVAFSFLPFSNLNDDTIPTCVSTYGASHMKFGWRGTHHFPPNRTRHTEYVMESRKERRKGVRKWREGVVRYGGKFVLGAKR